METCLLVSTRSNSVQTSSSPSTPLRDLWVQDVVAIKVNVTPWFTKNGVFIEEAGCSTVNKINVGFELHLCCIEIRTGSTTSPHDSFVLGVIYSQLQFCFGGKNLSDLWNFI